VAKHLRSLEGRKALQTDSLLRADAVGRAREAVAEAQTRVFQQAEFSGDGLRTDCAVGHESGGRGIEIICGRFDARVALQQPGDVDEEDPKIVQIIFSALPDQAVDEEPDGPQSVVDRFGEGFMHHEAIPPEMPTRRTLENRLKKDAPAWLINGYQNPRSNQQEPISGPAVLGNDAAKLKDMPKRGEADMVEWASFRIEAVQIVNELVQTLRTLPWPFLVALAVPCVLALMYRSLTAFVLCVLLALGALVALRTGTDIRVIWSVVILACLAGLLAVVQAFMLLRMRRKLREMGSGLNESRRELEDIRTKYEREVHWRTAIEGVSAKKQ
jgi:hypothetical protein